MYRLDRDSFSIKTFEEADQNKKYWLEKTPTERFKAAWYLICSAYNIDPENPPKMDRQAFSIRKHG